MLRLVTEGKVEFLCVEMASGCGGEVAQEMVRARALAVEMDRKC